MQTKPLRSNSNRLRQCALAVALAGYKLVLRVRIEIRVRRAHKFTHCPDSRHKSIQNTVYTSRDRRVNQKSAAAPACLDRPTGRPSQPHRVDPALSHSDYFAPCRSYLALCSTASQPHGHAPTDLNFAPDLGGGLRLRALPSAPTLPSAPRASFSASSSSSEVSSLRPQH